MFSSANSSLFFLFLFTLGCGDQAPTTATPTTTIYDAIYARDVNIVQQHMDTGTKPNANPIPEGFPLAGAYPLHLAALTGNEEIVHILLDNGARIDLEAKNKDRATPLHWAAFFAQKDIVLLLVQSGAPINFIDANNATPLDAAVFAKMVNQSDDRIAKQMGEIITILKENDGKSAKDLKK